MPDTIKERIEKEVEARLTSALTGWMADEVTAGRADSEDSDGASVFRWDARENTGKPFTIQITAGEERRESEAIESGTNYFEMVLTLTVEMLVAKRARALDPESSSVTHNRWLGRILTAIFDDSSLTEAATGEQLAVETHLIGTANPPSAEHQEQFYSTVDIEVQYQIYRDNPFAGPHTASN